MERRMQLEHFEEDTLDVVRRTEESMLEAGRKWARTLGEFMPVEMPVVRQVVKETFHFTEEVMRLQREFVHSVLVATRPATPPPARPKAAAHRPRPASRAHTA